MEDVIRTQTFNCPTVEEYGSVLSDSLGGYSVQLSEGSFSAHTNIAYSMNAVVLRVLISAASQSYGHIPPGFVAFGIPDKKTRELGRYWNSAHEDDAIVFCPGGGEVDLLLPQESVIVAAAIKEDVFREVFERLSGREWPDYENAHRFLRISNGARPPLGNSLDKLLRELTDEKNGNGEFLETTLINSIASAIPNTVDFKLPSSKRGDLVERAIFLAKSSNFKRPLSAICLDLGCSRKLLEIAFQDCKGCSPSQYLKVLRLNYCRELLLHANPSESKVSEIAESVGLKWSGYFAAQYNDFFGEFPKQTLNRHFPSHTQRPIMSPDPS
ncbi:MAG: hypothetical protein CMO55_23380 [Verrucomicrobiales bacterium]|nr:hypothetical protein [Verrucomicrobiales bacterium]